MIDSRSANQKKRRENPELDVVYSDLPNDLGNIHDYDTFLNQPLDKRNFRKRILSLDLIEETGKLRRTGKHRPAREYRVKHPKRVEIIK